MTRAELEQLERSRALADMVRRYREHNDRMQARLADVPPTPRPQEE